MPVAPLPINLTGITEREAIVDAVYRAVLAFDHNDEELLRSAITEDASLDFEGVLSCKGIDELKANVYDRVAKLDTLHLLSNVRVHQESSTTAKVSCSAMAQHCRRGQGVDASGGKYTSGALYLCNVVKVGNLWKVNKWDAQVIWLQGDASVMTGE